MTYIDFICLSLNDFNVACFMTKYVTGQLDDRPRVVSADNNAR